MILFKRANDLRQWLEKAKQNGLKSGFVPTMGALHAGHISLINQSKKSDDLTVASIFVNPTQFNNAADLEKYPKTIEADIRQLETAGCDILFLPSVAEMYPDGLQADKKYNLGMLETVLEGKFRPGHYQGVCMIVDKLLQLVQPHYLYLGQKDFQQCMVLQKMIDQLTGIDKPVIRICPTAREKDGLAMSSRNMRLTTDERKTAPKLFQMLTFIKENFTAKPLPELLTEAQKMITDAGFKPDYITIADYETLTPIQKPNDCKHSIALVAAYLHEIRLIDNLILS